MRRLSFFCPRDHRADHQNGLASMLGGPISPDFPLWWVLAEKAQWAQASGLTETGGIFCMRSLIRDSLDFPPGPREQE